MNFYGLTGFVTGFAIGMLINAYLLRGVSRDKLTSKEVSTRYGLLNWGIAIIGLLIGLAIEKTKH